MSTSALIPTQEVRKFLGWPSWAQPVIWSMMFLLGWHRLNRMYAKFADRKGMDFVRQIIASRHTKIRYFDADLDRIPRKGGLVVIANHPLGAMDGLILLQKVQSIRPDVKIMGNALLERVAPMKPYLLPINPFEGAYRTPLASGRALVRAKEWVDDGGVLIMFPAGEVSFFQFNPLGVRDNAWPKTSKKWLASCEAPVMPVDIHASNSFWFYLFGLLGTRVRTLMLPGEAVRRRWFYSVDLRFGNPLKRSEGQNPDDFAAELEAKRTMLRGHLPKKEGGRKLLKLRKRRLDPIAPEGDVDVIAQEIQAIRASGGLLTSHRDLDIVLAEGAAIPHALQEIGRLREITFRNIGEGAGRARDLDDYDTQYWHLILYHRDSRKIWGAYRLGYGPKLYAEHGMKGFYLTQFFQIFPPVKDLFRHGLEMGRSFIIPEAQVKPMPLFLLWKGIIHVLLRHQDELHYVFGCVSISNHYSRHSQAVMMAFVKHHFEDKHWSRWIYAKKAFRPRLHKRDRQFIANSSPSDVKVFDRMIRELEPGNLRMPVLIKKYLAQNAKVLALTRDADFNTVDALMYMKISDLPEETLRPVLEEIEANMQPATKVHHQV